MEEGKTPQEVLDELVKDDPDASLRQVGVVDFSGRSATFTGDALNYGGHGFNLFLH